MEKAAPVEVEKADSAKIQPVSADPEPNAFEKLAKLEKTPGYRIVWGAISVLAGVFWTYTFLKLFVFDVDVYLVNAIAPSLVWLLDYKSFAFLAVIGILFLFGLKAAIPVLAYVAFFPFVIVFWKLPRFLLRQKSWVLALAVVNALIGFATGFRRNVVVSVIWLIAVAISVTANNAWVLYASSSVLMILLMLMYKNTFVAVFRAPPIFETYKTIFSKTRSHLNTASMPNEVFESQKIADLPEEIQKKWASKIEVPVLYNRFCLFAARRLGEYQSSGVSLISGCLHLLFMIFVTTTTLGAVNYSLFVADKSAFDVSGTPSVFTFFFYSVNNFVFNFIKEVTPASPLAQSLWICGFVFALLLGVILVSLVFTERARRYDDELKRTISAIEEDGKAMEGFLKEHYSVVNVDDVIVELQRLQSGMAKVILFFAHRIR